LCQLEQRNHLGTVDSREGTAKKGDLAVLTIIKRRQYFLDLASDMIGIVSVMP
jgi:hypothetical protein